MGRSGSHARLALVDALNREWPAVVRDASGIVIGWSERHEVLCGSRHLDEVLAQLGRTPDPVLYALLSEARGGCRLAARVVLQSMLGKLVLMSRRTLGAGIDDFVIALWCRIATYPLERRPRRIAANLALDALKDARRLAGEAARPPELTSWSPADLCGVDRAQWPAARSPTAPDLIAAAVEARVIATESAAVLMSVYVDGLTSSRAAERHRTTPELVRYRCSRATGKMRNQISDVLAAA